MSGINKFNVIKKYKEIFIFIVFIFFHALCYAIPTVTFIPPTENNGIIIEQNYTFINITTDEDLNASLIEWGNSSGFSNISMSNSSLINWYINMTNLNDYEYNYTIWTQNTTEKWNQSERRFIEIDAVEDSSIHSVIIIPEDNSYVSQNHTFVINASVVCKYGNCSNISARARYNKTTSVPDTNINETFGATPFYIVDGTNAQNCTNNPLEEDEICYINWTVNTTGNINEVYEINVFFESNDTNILSNYTSNSTVKISNFITITTYFEEVNFGVNNPGESSISASQNNNYYYNITVDSDAEYLWIKGENMTNDDNIVDSDGNIYIIPVYELKWNIFNSISSARNMSESWQKLNYNNIPLSAEENKTLFWWLNIPYSIAKGGYSGVIYFMANNSYS